MLKAITMTERLVVTNRMKKLVKTQGMRTSQKAVDQLSEYCQEIIIMAAVRAKKDRRKTIMKRDIIKAFAYDKRLICDPQLTKISASFPQHAHCRIDGLEPIKP